MALAVATTTRQVAEAQHNLKQLSLFKDLVPSIVKTAEVGFEYRLYVAHDLNDAFYDSPSTHRLVRQHLQDYLLAPLGQRGIRSNATILRYNNTLRKPGPVFNFMMAAAAADGADFLYRLNDDTALVDAWASQAVAALRSFDPPFVGVVGPVCDEGNKMILTHDIVSATHLQIFPTYYPPVFTDWWMDDWISQVYGDQRTQKGPFTVRHLTHRQGTRYSVDSSHSEKLPQAVEDGKEQIEKWVTEFLSVERSFSTSQKKRHSPFVL